MNTQYRANSWILREFLASVKHLLAILCLLWQVQLQSREWWWGTPGHSSLLIQGRTARLGCFLTAWGHFLSRWFFPLWKSCFLVLLFIPLCHSPCPHSFLLLSLPRHSGCCCQILTSQNFKTLYRFLSPRCFLVLIFLQRKSILRYWQAEYIMDPLVNHSLCSLEEDRSSSLLLSWPILALIR